MSSGTTCTCKSGHLVGGSGTPLHALRRMIGIARICVGIIVCEFHFEARTGGQLDRRDIAILFLPVEVPIANPDQPLLAAVGQDRPALHVPADVVRVRDDADRLQIYGCLEMVGDFVVARTGRYIDVIGDQRYVGDPFGGRLSGEVESQLGLIGLRLAGGMVVDLHHQVGTLAQNHLHAFGHTRGLHAGRPSAERSAWQKTGRAEAGIVHAFSPRDVPRIEEEQSVMHDAARLGTKFDAADILVFGQIQRNYEAPVLIGTVRRDSEGLRHAKDDVGRAQLPAFGEAGKRRELSRVALGCAVGGPVPQCGDRIIGEAAPALKMSVSGFGLPRWHIAARRYGGDQFRALRCICIGE